MTWLDHLAAGVETGDVERCAYGAAALRVLPESSVRLALALSLTPVPDDLTVEHVGGHLTVRWRAAPDVGQVTWYGDRFVAWENGQVVDAAMTLGDAFSVLAAALSARVSRRRG